MTMGPTYKQEELNELQQRWEDDDVSYDDRFNELLFFTEQLLKPGGSL